MYRHEQNTATTSRQCGCPRAYGRPLELQCGPPRSFEDYLNWGAVYVPCPQWMAAATRLEAAQTEPVDDIGSVPCPPATAAPERNDAPALPPDELADRLQPTPFVHLVSPPRV
jgi:hypothetical protein